MTTNFDAWYSFGVEEIFLNEAKSMRYDYDLKTNKDDLISARDEFIDFIYALNDLSTVEEIRAFYEKKMDVDLFLKTYATIISILTKKESVTSFRMITTIFLEQTVLMATTLQQEILLNGEGTV